MSFGNIFKIIALLVLIYTVVRFLDTRKYIYKLPRMTREKYIGLDKLGIRIFSISLALFAVAVLVPNELVSIILSSVIIYMLATLISELNILKEYVYLKRKMK